MTPSTGGGGSGGGRRTTQARSGRRAGGSYRPRTLVVFLLIGFLIVAIGVITRRTYGLRETRAIAELDARRDSLSNAQAQLEAEIRNAVSRTRLVPLVEQRLNMRVPKPEQQITLPRSLVPSIPPSTPRPDR